MTSKNKVLEPDWGQQAAAAGGAGARTDGGDGAPTVWVHAQDGFMPSKAHESDVGFDCRAAIDEPIALQPGSMTLVPLGFGIATPVGYTSDIRPRSGLSSRGIVVMYGTVDPGYRGEVKACVCNLSNMPFVVQPKDRIAQLVILPAPQLALTSIGALDDTDRSDGGFGSTGVK